MSQQAARRNHTTVAYSSNNKVSEDLSRGMILRELHLTLTQQPTVTTANNTAAKAGRGDDWAVIKRIDVIANGTNVIKSISGLGLVMLNFFLYGRMPTISTALGAGGANPSLSSTLILPFWMPRAVKPIDTALDTRRLSDLTIEITWGTHTDVSSSATGYTTAPSLRVSGYESFNIQGEFAQWRFWEIQKEVTATNSSFQIDLPVGHMFRGFMINTTDAAVDDGDVINNFKWKSGLRTFADITEEELKRVSLAHMGLQRSFSGTGYDDLMVADDFNFDGWYFYDHAPDGFLSESVDTIGLSSHELELDVTVGGGTTKVYVWPMTIIPVRAGA